MSCFSFCSLFLLLSICLRCDKSIILFSNFNSSQTLEFDTSWELVTALFFQVSSQTKTLSLWIRGFFLSWWILNLRIFFFYLILTYRESSKIFQLGSLLLHFSDEKILILGVPIY